MGIARNKRRQIIKLKQQAGQVDLMRPRKGKRRFNGNERKVISNR